MNDTLVVVSHRLLVIAQAIVSITQKMAGFSFTLYIIQLLAKHQVILVKGHSLTKFIAGTVAIAQIAQSAGFT